MKFKTILSCFEIFWEPPFKDLILGFVVIVVLSGIIGDFSWTFDDVVLTIIGYLIGFGILAKVGKMLYFNDKEKEVLNAKESKGS